MDEALGLASLKCKNLSFSNPLQTTICSTQGTNTISYPLDKREAS